MTEHDEHDIDEHDEYQEYDVDVTFAGPKFTIIVHWTTDTSSNDEVRIAAASEWFEDTHGINPSDRAIAITVTNR